MLGSVLPSKNKETEISHITREDAHCLADVPRPDEATIKINVQQDMHGKDAFKLPAHPYCFGTKSCRRTSLMQIEEIAGLLGDAITSIMTALASVH